MSFEFKFPDVGEGLTEGDIVKWHVKEGDNVKKDQVIAEVETAKAVVEIPSPKAGRVAKIYHKEGETVNVGEVLLTIDEKGDSTTQPEEDKTISTQKTKAQEVKKSQTKQSNENLAEKSGGVVGFIEEADDNASKKQVDKIHIARNENQTAIFGSGTKPTDSSKEIAKPTLSAPKVVMNSQGKTLHIPLSTVRRAIANHMTKSWNTIPHVMHYDEADVTKLWEVRKKEKKIAEQAGIHLTFLPFIIRACLAAFKENPYLNASLDESKGTIIVKNYYNIGIAVDAPQGLVVPVIKNADQKSIMDLAQELGTLAQKARDKKLTPDDMSGGTFTITNIGSVGGIAATPIINHPEAAILGLFRIFDKPLAIDGKVKVRKVLPLTITFDHRIIDGARAAKFMNDLKLHLEDPDRLLVDIN